MKNNGEIDIRKVKNLATRRETECVIYLSRR
jgi:hypothetical protein